MKNRNLVQCVSFFIAGLTVASIIQFYYPGVKEALADQYSCIRQDLDAQGMTGNIPDPEFTITYDVPSCYGSSGYRVSRVYMYGNQVAVHYAGSAGKSAGGSNYGKGAGGVLRAIP